MLIFKTNIMTREEFAERWQQHYPTMGLQAEVSFYYDRYQRICSVAKDGSKKINEVFKWTVEDSTDLNYGLRVLERLDEAIEVLWLGNFQRQRCL